MLYKIILFLFAVHVTFVSAAFYEGCDKVENLTASSVVIFESQNYSAYNINARYPTGSSCRIHYKAPVGYIVRAQGFINLERIPSVSNCATQSQRFIYSRDGDINLTDGEISCGTGPIDAISIGSELVLAYTSEPDGRAGRFRIRINTIKITNDTCRCGWGRFSFEKIKKPGVFKGFTSIAGIINEENDAIIGTGVVISQEFILTSAHIFANGNSSVSSLKVLVGYRDYPSDDDTNYQATYEISTIIINKEYTSASPTPLHDVALVKTKVPIRYNRGVSPICTPMERSFYDEMFYINRVYDLAGWNKFNESEDQQHVKNETAVSMPLDLCERRFKSINLNVTTLLCLSNFTTPVQPDYPGAVLIFSSGDKKFIIGSVNPMKRPESTPMLFTRTSNYIAWIRTVSENTFLCSRFF